MPLSYHITLLLVATFLACQTAGAFVVIDHRNNVLPSYKQHTTGHPFRFKGFYSALQDRNEQKHQDDDNDARLPVDSAVSRRDLFRAIAGGVAIALPSWMMMMRPQSAEAAPPLSLEDVDNFRARAQRKLRPRPSQVALRPKLNKDFAALMMGSSHQALDDLDCVPMDQYQRDLSVVYQAEYAQYENDLSPEKMKKGDLTDPNTFDLLSFVQYATINRELSADAPFVFTEQKPLQMTNTQVEDDDLKLGPAAIVKRDSSLTNDILAPTHSHMVASAILDHMETTYRGSKDALPVLPSNTRPGSATILTSLSQLVHLFLLNGYALGGNAAIGDDGHKFGDARGTTFVLSLTNPATLWSGQALQLLWKTDAKGGRTQMHNDYLLKTAKEMMTRFGYDVTAQSISYEGNQAITSLKIG